MLKKILLGLFLFINISVFNLSFAHGPFLANAQDFINFMVTEHNFEREYLENVISNIKTNNKVINLIKPAKEGGRVVYWDEYRDRHVTVGKIANGVLFAKENANELNRAAEIYGVPPEIIIAILGIETRYGDYTGEYSTVEALANLAFNYPPRADYFYSELKQLFLFARDTKQDITKIKGSYAGAMGVPQFMPTSALTWAVDFDRSGKADLFNFTDSIGSVANFLLAHGWQRGVPIAYPINPTDNASPKQFLTEDISPRFSIEELTKAGLPIDFGNNEKYTGDYVLVDLNNVDEVEYRAGTINFYVITRYNKSFKYASSVMDLASEIRRRI